MAKAIGGPALNQMNATGNTLTPLIFKLILVTKECLKTLNLNLQELKVIKSLLT